MYIHVQYESMSHFCTCALKSGFQAYVTGNVVLRVINHRHKESLLYHPLCGLHTRLETLSLEWKCFNHQAYPTGGGLLLLGQKVHKKQVMQSSSVYNMVTSVDRYNYDDVK